MIVAFRVKQISFIHSFKVTLHSYRAYYQKLPIVCYTRRNTPRLEKFTKIILMFLVNKLNKNVCQYYQRVKSFAQSFFRFKYNCMKSSSHNQVSKLLKLSFTVQQKFSHFTQPFLSLFVILRRLKIENRRLKEIYQK